MGPAELFDQDPNNTASVPAGVSGGGGMQLTDLVPVPPVEPMALTTENPSLPYGDFSYDVVRTSDPGFKNIDRESPPEDGEGDLWTYHWHPEVDPITDPEQLQVVRRKLTAPAAGGLAVTVADTELQIAIDTTGWQAGDILYFDGTNITNYSLNDSGGTTNAYPVSSPEPIRILRGDVNDDGTEGHGDEYALDTLWTSTNTGVGLFSVSFGYAFPEVPTVTLAVSFNVPSQRSRVISFTSPPATGGFAVAIQEFNETTQQFDYIDVGFHFIAIGLNGNY